MKTWYQVLRENNTDNMGVKDKILDNHMVLLMTIRI